MGNLVVRTHGDRAGFIWGIADLIRDVFKRGKYQDVILPFTVLRRIDCVLAPTKQAVLDWYSRCVVAWELDQTLAIDFVLAAMGRALGQARPKICNSDQGSQFTSPQWAALLQEAGVRPSMNGRGRALDNCFVERLWRSVKYEEGLPARLCQPARGAPGLGPLLQLLQPRAAAPGPRVLHARTGPSLDERRPPWGAGAAPADGNCLRALPGQAYLNSTGYRVLAIGSTAVQPALPAPSRAFDELVCHL